ncbi:tannase/feruloyl esterase family alpha/beta hydrolase [Stutzerimonas stutzeri]|uniref:tannase/feruloyl esterase family alpha/beta hydrolase n=1 Tax=Stutzerimonas stutzeri TaxID=316 RepID=UPI000ED21EE1|nr:tannase/feruloyl esterase family alpha/beta hydrolase [Stutzerimonas stutzeri]MDH0085186.1 tannase/feruloyl esterase family alpha/beta hydrolase [Stutzerimonas stutzeri]HCA62770.1 tannase/feruloyl esterase family alpha/beta hydrolase [Pseudomonas sp.]
MKISLFPIALLALLCSGTSGASAVTEPAHDGLAALEVVRPSRTCSSLLTLDLASIGGSGSRVTSASVQDTDQGVTVCNVEGTLAPSIGFRVQLPLDGWTQRYLQVGCGGLCGRISLRPDAVAGCVPFESGRFVVASTDMGHQGNGGTFGANPQQRADFAHRGVHLTARAAKALIKTFYDRAPAYSYFSGCSDGGREALIEAQRYPDDFDGIVAGAPAMNFQVQNSLLHAWQARVNRAPDGRSVLVASQLPLLHRAVLEQCDGLDGQLDGLLSDPRICRFDPATIQCPAGQDSDQCLTAAQVQAARRIYDGPRDERTGERLAVGGPQPGSELAWGGVFVPERAHGPLFSETIALEALRYLVFEQAPQPGYRLEQLRFDAETFDRLRARHPLFDATDPDLSAFAEKGGKLILWHGWSDHHISPINTIAYHEALQRHLGKPEVERFVRMYLVPGMYHCHGGQGPSELDLLTPLMRWVESGQAADEIKVYQASRSGLPLSPKSRRAKTGRTPEYQPVYPYPAVARLVSDGEGERYTRGEPLTDTPTPAWRGADFYQPYRPRER